MRMYVYEGTLEEIKVLQRELMSNGSTAIAVGVSDPSADREGNKANTPGRAFVSTEVAFRCLMRRPLSPEQRAVIAAIYRSHSEGVLASALQEEIGYSTSQFAGLMGAFGRRLASTQGYLDYTWFFDNQWEAESNCNRYHFPESVLRAVEQANLV